MTTYSFKKNKPKKYKTEKFGVVTIYELSSILGVHKVTARKLMKEHGVDAAIEIALAKDKREPISVSYLGNKISITEAEVETGIRYSSIYSLVYKKGITLDEYLIRLDGMKNSCARVNSNSARKVRAATAKAMRNAGYATCRARTESK